MTTIELSTIIPIPSTNPDSETILIVIPSRWKNSNDTINASGMVIVTSTGVRKSCMNRKMIRQASRAPTMMSLRRLPIEYSSNCVWSRVTVNCTCGYSFRKCCIKPLISARRSLICASDCLMTAIETAL